MLQAPLGLGDLLGLREPQGPQERLEPRVQPDLPVQPERQDPLEQTAHRGLLDLRARLGQREPQVRMVQTALMGHKDPLGLLDPLGRQVQMVQMAQTGQMEPPPRLP